MAKAFEKAAWIWRQGEIGRDEFCDFLDTVCIPDEGKRYTLRIAADSNYTVWMNGEICAFGQYGDYPDYKVYDEVDITDHLRAGENRMVTVVWYYGIDSQTYKLGDAGLIYEIADEDGAVLTYTHAGTLSRKSRDYPKAYIREILPGRYLPHRRWQRHRADHCGADPGALRRKH